MRWEEDRGRGRRGELKKDECVLETGARGVVSVLSDFVDDTVRAFADLLKLVVAVHTNILDWSSGSNSYSRKGGGSHDGGTATGRKLRSRRRSG